MREDFLRTNVMSCTQHEMCQLRKRRCVVKVFERRNCLETLLTAGDVSSAGSLSTVSSICKDDKPETRYNLLFKGAEKKRREENSV